MAIDLQRIINSGFGISFLSTLARLIPVSYGHHLADFVADRIAARPKSRIVQAVRANQWVISGETLDNPALDLAVRETFRNITCSIFDLYHYLPNPDATKQLLVFDDGVQRLVQRPEFDRRGLMVLGLHISNFDLVLRFLTLQGLHPLVLTLPNPQGSQRVEYEMRKQTGMNLLPASLGTFRQAIKYMQRGGVALTGIDRPVPAPRSRPRFFGRPSDLPMHYIYLAVKAQVPVLIMVTIRQPDGKNHVYTSELIELEHHPDPNAELEQNAEKVLEVGESFLRRAPRQWAITLPVWPEALEQMPH